MTEQKCMGQKGKRHRWKGQNNTRVITIGCSIMKPIRWDACIIPTISAGSRKAGAIIWHISAWIMTKWKPQV